MGYIRKQDEEMHIERLNNLISHKNIKKEFLEKQIDDNCNVKEFILEAIHYVDNPYFKLQLNINEQILRDMDLAEEYSKKENFLYGSIKFREAGKTALGMMCKYLDEDYYTLSKTCFENAQICDEAQVSRLLKNNEKGFAENYKKSSEGYHFIAENLGCIKEIIKDYFFIGKNIETLMERTNQEKQLFSLASSHSRLLRIIKDYSKRKNKNELNFEDFNQITFDYLCDKISEIDNINKIQGRDKDSMMEHAMKEIKEISLFGEIPLNEYIESKK
jgi:hypothetical protein